MNSSNRETFHAKVYNLSTSSGKSVSPAPFRTSMTNSFRSASCAAPLEFAGTATQKCPYCGSTVIAPSDMLYSHGPAFLDLSSLTGIARKIAEITRLVRDGRTAEAINRFRETFGVGTVEAKHAIDRMTEGRSVAISGMQIGTESDLIDPQSLKAVKKIAYTAGGSIVVMILATSLIIGGIAVAAVFFAGSSASDSFSTNSTDVSEPSPKFEPTPIPDHEETLRFGGEGNGAGRFKDNRHVAVDGEGRIYSSDYSPHRIQVFDADGRFVNQWAPETGSNLYDLVSDRAGNVFVANNKGIFKHDGRTGRLLAKSTDIKPRGIALTWDGKLVSVAGKSIVILDSSLNTLTEFTDAAERANSIFGFEKVATDGSGVIYALDRHNKQVCKFSPDGKFLDRFATGAPGAHAIAVDPKGRLFVSNTSSILAFDSEGQQVRTLKTYQAFGIAFDQNGHLLVAARPNVLKYKLNF